MTKYTNDAARAFIEEEFTFQRSARARAKQRKTERAVKQDILSRCFDKSEIEIDVLEFDESEIFELAEARTRYEIAH
jgi:hypothetical protein